MKLILATNNVKKITEIRQILGGTFEVIGLIEASIDIEMIEDCQTFSGNAIRKALAVSKATGELSLADDSGLVVESLDGAPGIHSARYAGEMATDEDKNQKILQNLRNTELRAAYFQCAIAMVDCHEKIEVVEGICRGSIAIEPVGTQGFGYDPIFIPEGYNKTFAELGLTVKNQISHRAKALRLAMKIVQNWHSRLKAND